VSDKVQAEMERARQIAQEFKRRFPQAFSDKPQPLKWGIQYDLIDAMPDFPRQDVLNAWTWYSVFDNDGAYFRCLVDGRPRVNLEGKIVGRVTFEEHAQAAKASRIRLGEHQLAVFAQQQRALQRERLNVIAGGRSEPEVLADVFKEFANLEDKHFEDEHLTPAARLALRMVPAVLNHDAANFRDIFDRITKLMAAYVDKKGKELADRPDLLMMRTLGEMAAVIAGEPLLRDAVVRYLATTVDDDPHTHEPEGDKPQAETTNTEQPTTKEQHTTANKDNTFITEDQLRVLAEFAIQDAMQHDNTFSERLDMAAQQLAAVVEYSDHSLLFALAEHYIEHLMKEERRNE